MPADPTRKQLVERRIWRLGYLLGGDAARAAALVDRVLHANREAVDLEPARLDRLVIMRARELPPGRGSPAPGVDEPVTQALKAITALPEQPREAWVLTHVDLLDELHVSRAMDCSKTAARNHLHAGEQAMAARLGAGLVQAGERLRAFADALDPGPIIDAHRAAARKRRTNGALLTALIVGTLVLLGLLTVLKLTG